MSSGKRLQFLDFGDYASAGDHPAHRLQGHLTIEAWVRTEPPSSSPTHGGIITKLYTDGGPGEHGGYGLLRGDNAYLIFYVAGSSLDVAQAPCLPDGAWHHVAGVYDGAALSIYVDGELRATRAVSIGASPPVYQPNTALLLGRHNHAPNSPASCGFGGRICEARLWSRARTQGELARTMNLRLTGMEEGLVGYWPLDEGVGDQGQDRCGTAPLTVHGATWADGGAPVASSPEPDGARLDGWASTASILSAALESLNRTSALGLLDQIVQALNTEDAALTSDLDAARTSVAALLSATVRQIQGTTTTLTAGKNSAENQVDAFEGSLHAQQAQLPSALDTGVTTRLAAQNEAIHAGTLQATLSRVEGVVEQVLEDQGVDRLSQDVSAIQQSVVQTLDDANALGALELAAVKGVIEHAIMSMNLAPFIEKAQVSVNGALVRLDQLVQRLAARPEVQAIDLTYDDDNLRSAVFSFADGTKAVFTAKRIDLPDLAVHYHLRTEDLRGLPAEFELRFALTSRTGRLGDRDVVVDEYEPVYHSSVLFSISIP